VGEYRVLERTALADCALEVEGHDLDDLFETAGRALTETMLDPATLPGTVEHELRLEAQTLEWLLYEWLSELIARKDEHGIVYTRLAVKVQDGQRYLLTAQAQGGSIVRGRTELRADPKGVSLQRFEVTPFPGGWHARFVLDL
jgi:SHS2 domain-containing protein